MYQQHKKFKVLVIGDSCIDNYIFGKVERISPEAPVPVLTITKSIQQSGMAANVMNNLLNLGVECVGLFGNKISIKTRFIDERSKQHIIRVDDDNFSEPIIVPKQTSYDAIVVSDYNKGSVQYQTLIELANEYTTIPIFVDTKKTNLKIFDKYSNVYFKINKFEFEKLVEPPEQLIVTNGNEGAIYKTKRFYLEKQVDVVDVCGAGDTFLSALCFMFLQTADIEESIKFANRAASITVTHQGTYAPTIDEINKVFNI